MEKRKEKKEEEDKNNIEKGKEEMSIGLLYIIDIYIPAPFLFFIHPILFLRR